MNLHRSTSTRGTCRPRSIFWLALPALAFALACTGGADVREGRLQRVVVDRPETGESTIEYLLQTDQGEPIELQLGNPADRDLATGARLRVVGTLLPDFAPGDDRSARPRLQVDSVEQLQPAADSESGALTVNAPPPARKLGVFLFNFANDDRQPISVAEARQKVFTDPHSVRAFHKEQSFGFIDLGGKVDKDGDVFGWFTLPANNRPCMESKWDDMALALAAQQGIDTTGYDHYVFVFPYTDACLYGGRGEQPGHNTWINGGSITVMNHELGHNFGTPHASTWTCTNAAGTRVTLGGTCRSTEYGNPFDVMGHGYRHTNAYNKAHARWLGNNNIQDVGKDGVYTLFPQEQPSMGVQLLSTVASDTSWFYVEYRQPFGYDDFAPESAAATGVLVMLGGSLRNLGNSYLLDTNPATTTFADAPLGVGKTFTDPRAGVKITLVERNTLSAQVRFEFVGGIARDGGNPAATDAGTDSRSPDPSAGRDDGGGPGSSDGGPIGPEDGGNADASVVSGPAVGAGGTGNGTGAGGTGGSRRPPVNEPLPTVDRPGGCSCTLAGPGAERPGSWVALALAAIAAAARRRRPGRQRAPRGHHHAHHAAPLVALAVVGGALLGNGCKNESPVGAPSDQAQMTPRGTGGARGGRGGSTGTPGSSPEDAGAAPSDAALADVAGGSGAVDAGGGITDAGNASSRIVVPSAPPEIATACARFAEIYCTRLDECVTDGVLLNYGDVTFCRARREQACRLDLQTPGRHESPQLRQTCSDALAAEACRDFAFSRPLPACDYPPGTLAEGAPCFRSSQCGPGLSCEIETDEACGTCAPTLPVGGDCSFWTGGCPIGTACYADQCLAPLGPMAACKRTAATCLGGLACSASGCVEKLGDVGADCTGADICDTVKGLFCNLMTGKCAANPAPVAIGTLCGVVDATGARSRCAPGVAVCFSPPASPTRRLCVARVAAGAKCDPAVGPVCAPPSECVRGVCVVPTIVAGPAPTYRTCP